MNKKKHQPRSKLVSALAYCVDILCTQSLLEGSGAIRAALETDNRIWNHFEQATKTTLGEGLGHYPPKDQV